MGDLATVPATELGSTAIRAAVERASISAASVDEVFMGCVLPAGLKQCPARQAARNAGLPDDVGAVTVNKACGSGMQATIFGIDSIRAGTNRVAVTGGLESMSNAPHLMPTGRAGQRLGHTSIYDHMFIDGLEDAYTGAAMGTFAQKTADDHGITREAMDAFAIQSLSRAQMAIEQGSSESRDGDR
jgi:acetyl-CoA C-acetyltransferase